jgi:hypothetical protein
MPINNENYRGAVPIRLSFRSSENLNNAMQQFIWPDIREGLRKSDRRFRLFSQQVAFLGLTSGFEVAQDRVDINKYEDSVAAMSHTEFNLTPDVEIGHDNNRFVELRFNLFLHESSQRRGLIQPPLFPRTFSDEVGIYTRIPTDRLVGRSEFNAAEVHLRRAMGERASTQVAMAPWKMNVGDARVMRIPKNDAIPINRTRSSNI